MHHKRTLSHREAQVLRLTMLGYDSKGAAEVLGISPATVRTHRDTIRRKLGARTMPHAVAIYLGWAVTEHWNATQTEKDPD